jgi:thioredoxin 1
MRVVRVSDLLERVSADTFAEQVLASDQPFLLEFTAAWCAPCAALEPVLNEVALEKQGLLRVGQLDLAEDGEVGERFGVQTAPTMLLFMGGEPVRRLMGAKNKRNLLEALRDYLD